MWYDMVINVFFCSIVYQVMFINIKFAKFFYFWCDMVINVFVLFDILTNNIKY